jgi:hypothetical protein
MNFGTVPKAVAAPIKQIAYLHEISQEEREKYRSFHPCFTLCPRLLQISNRLLNEHLFTENESYKN